MRTNIGEENRTEIPGKVVVGGLGVLFLLAVGIVLGFTTGMMETLGIESRDIRGNGLTSTQSGYSWGLKTFYFAKGQNFFCRL